MLPKSVNSRAFSSDLTLEETAKKCAASGILGIELSIDHQGELTFDAPRRDCEAVLRVLREHGVAVTSLTSNLFLKFNFAATQETDRNTGREIALLLLERALWLEAPIVQIIPAVVGRAEDDSASVSYEKALTLSCQGLTGIMVDAEKRGVKVAVQSTGNRFLLSPVEMRDLVDRVNSPALGVALNLSQLLDYGFPEDWLRILRRRVVHLSVSHLADQKIEKVSGDAPGIPGLNVSEIKQALKEIDYPGAITFQGRGSPEEVSRTLSTFCVAE